MWNMMFFVENMMLGVGLAMDAFSVSMANGLNEPRMRKGRMVLIAGMFAGFQAAMPLIGWICIHTVVQYFTAFEKLVPWIALILLVYIGQKMVRDGIESGKEEFGASCAIRLGLGELIVQGIATSIDALSVGFTIAEYNRIMALVAAALIGIVTFFICLGGLQIGKTFGTKLSNKAQIFGGVILIIIGIEIFIKGI